MIWLCLLRFQDVTEALHQLRSVLSHMAAKDGVQGTFPFSQLHWLLATAAGYSTRVLSEADVAAVFLSRKLLLTDVFAAREQRQAVISAALLVAAVEGAWQVHERTRRVVPFGRISPLYTGLKAARVAVWSAALILSFKSARTVCHSAGERVNARLIRLGLFSSSLPITTPENSPDRPHNGLISAGRDRFVDNQLYDEESPDPLL
jgi:hypothetical protein